MPSTPPPTKQNAPAASRAKEAHYQAFLDELIEADKEMIRLINESTKALDAGASPQSPVARLADTAVAFDRISRAVCRSILLSQSLTGSAPARLDQYADARRDIIREVEEAIQRLGPQLDEEDLLEDELFDCMDIEDIEDVIDDRPIGEVIADICRDLGLAAQMPVMEPWKRHVAFDIALLCARAARPAAAQLDVVPDAGEPTDEPTSIDPSLVPSPDKTGGDR